MARKLKKIGEILVGWNLLSPSALEDALAAYEDPEGWRRLVTNGMQQDFSWASRAEEYRAVYRRVLG